MDLKVHGGQAEVPLVEEVHLLQAVHQIAGVDLVEAPAEVVEQVEAGRKIDKNSIFKKRPTCMIGLFCVPEVGVRTFICLRKQMQLPT